MRSKTVLAGLLIVGLVVVVGMYFKLWLRAFVTRARIALPSLVLMSLRRVNPRAIVDAKITAVQAGLADISTNGLESHYLAGGNVRRVIRAMIAARRLTPRHGEILKGRANSATSGL